MQRTSLHSPSAPRPHSQQHFQVTSEGLPQNTGAPLGFLFPSLRTLFLKKKKSCTLLDRMPQCKEYSPSIFKPPFAKHLELGFVLFCFLITPPHNLKLLHVLIIQFQNTKLLLHRVLMKRPTQLDNHRFCHERAARCPPPSLLPGRPPGFEIHAPY